MPTASDLENVSALVTRLLALAQAAPGGLIRAQDWNIVVGGLAELAQTMVATATDTPVPPHQHSGQVKLDWLDPALTTLVQRGPLGDPDQVGRLQAAQRELAALRADLDRLRADLNQLRLRLTDLSGRDLTRESQVGSVSLQLAGVTGVRDDVTALRASLASVQQNIAAAIAVGQQLSVGGQPVDMTALTGRIATLESFRDAFKTASGQLLDAAAIDDHIAGKTSGLVSRTDLDTILNQRPVVIPPGQVQTLIDTVKSAVTTDVTTTMTQLADAIRAQTDQRLAGVDTLVGRAVSDALPGLTNDILARVRPETNTAVQAAVTQLQTLLERRLGETQTAVQTQFTQQLKDLQTQLNTSVRDQLQRQIAASLDPLQKRLDDLDSRVKLTSATVALHDTTLNTLGQRVETVARTDAAGRDQLQRALGDQLQTQVEIQVNQVTTARLRDINARIDRLGRPPS
jgi:hypothetical protein